jgi:hypothetical protein
MWRGAHGRLAAIAVLAGGLSSCLPTPRHSPPIRTEADVDDDDHEHDGHRADHQHHPICAGVRDDRTPEQRQAEVVRNIEAAAMRCTGWAARDGRQGEVHVTVSKAGVVSVSREPTSDLTEVDEVCVSNAVSLVVKSRQDWSEAYPRDLVLHLALGKAPPLFAHPAKFFTQWLAAMRAKPARERFVAQLPAEVALEDDSRCLLLPSRPVFSDGFEAWVATAATPLSIYWQPDVTWSIRHQGDLVAGLTAHGNPKTHVYLVGEQGLLLRNPPKADETEQTVCLLPLDASLRKELRARVDRRGSCWVGGLRDILLDPRTEFRTNRPLNSVADGGTRTCALDDSGAPVCCGERTEEDPPAGSYMSIAVGGDFDCGITTDGGLRCWGYWVPARGAVMTGPYAQVVVEGHNMCALRRDTRALECWLGEPRRMVTVARDKIRDIAALHGDVCVLLEDGKVACRGFYVDAKWREIQGAFRAFAASSDVVCGLTAPDSRELRCWENDWRGWRPAPAPDPARPMPAPIDEPTELAMSWHDGCVLGRSGRIACWRSPARRSWDGVYRMIAGSSSRLCAVTVDGRVECDREWPYFKQ